MRLGTWRPFEQVPEAVFFFTKVRIGEETARRLTEQAGAAQVAVEAAAVDILEREPTAASPPGPAVQQVSVDGAMVPLVGGEWAEVKTVVVGTVEPSGGGEVPREVHTKELSYFSRLADSATFTREATVELHRRGTFQAGTVLPPKDGWSGVAAGVPRSP